MIKKDSCTKKRNQNHMVFTVFVVFVVFVIFVIFVVFVLIFCSFYFHVFHAVSMGFRAVSTSNSTLFHATFFSTFDRFHTAKLCVKFTKGQWNQENGKHESGSFLLAATTTPMRSFHGCNLLLLVRTGACKIEVKNLRK